MPKPRIAIICFEDDPNDVELLQRHLNQLTDWHIDLLAFPDFDAGARALDNRSGDLIILDYLLGGEDGIQVLQRLRAHGNTTPVVIITGADPDLVEADLESAGAIRIVQKDDLCPDLLAELIRDSLAAKRSLEAEHRVIIPTVVDAAEFNSRLREASDQRRQEVQEILSLLRASIFQAQKDGLAGSIPDLGEPDLGKTCESLDAAFEEFLRLKEIEHCGLGADQQSLFLSSLVRDVVSQARFEARRRKVRISYQVDLDLPEVIADPENMTCVLACIVRRAIHQSPPDAEVEVCAKLSPHGDSVLVAVRPSEVIDKTPEFSQLGTGELELEGCQDIVARHGGTLWIEPEANGLAVGFELPIAGQSPLPEASFGQRKQT